MITNLKLVKAVRSTSPVAQWALPALFTALGLLYGFQARLLLKNVAGRSTTTESADGLQVRANGISLAVLSYMQNHDGDSLGRIETEGKEISQLVDELRKNAIQTGEENLWTPLFRSYDEMRQATIRLLAADHRQTGSRQALNAAGESLMTNMMARMEPSIKPNQSSSSERLQAILAAAAEARSVIKNPEDFNAVLASQKRFRRAVEKYAELSRTRHAGRWAEESISFFAQCVIQAQDLQKTEERKQESLAHYMQKKNVFDIVLQESRVIHAQGFTVKHLFSAEVACIALGAILLIAGLLLAVQKSQAAPLSRLQNILSCVEAAAAGDVSRLPETGHSDEVGLLSRAVGRLILVLARSENLVYHLAALVESSGDAIISHTLEGAVLSWNKGAQRLYGYSADEMKGKSIARLASEEARPDMDRYLQQLRKGQKILPFETLHSAKNGRSVCALVRVSAIYDSTKQIIGASFSAQELTDVPAVVNKAIPENEAV